MKKEELTTLGLTEDQAAKVFELHGKDITKLQGTITTLTTDRDGLKKQLDDANNQIEKFKGMNIDGIKKAADDWKGKYEKAKADYDSAQAARVYDDAVRKALSGVKFSSKFAKNAFIGLLKEKSLKIDNGKLIGFDDVLKQAKTDDPNAFAPVKPGPKFTDKMDGDGAPEITKKAFDKMTYLEKLKLKTEQPDVYKGLLHAKPEPDEKKE
jgi:hypothetical protein